MLEIERKYLVKSTEWIQGNLISTHEIHQAYLFQDEEKSIRIRVKESLAFLTIKMGQGTSRHEFEYSIPKLDAIELIEKARLRCLQKTRYEVQYESHIWEIDVFHGKHQGLVLAEIELQSESEFFEVPEWIGEEVTHDPRYLNVNLFKEL